MVATRESLDWQSQHTDTDYNACNSSGLNGHEKYYNHDDATSSESPFHLATPIPPCGGFLVKTRHQLLISRPDFLIAPVLLQ
jgi:hypothetical protein